jgi:hypothetical protein
MAVVEIHAKQKPSIRWTGADAVQLKFSGVITLNARDEADAALFESLELGEFAALTVEVVGEGAAIKWSAGSDGETPAITAVRSLRIMSVYPAK